MEEVLWLANDFSNERKFKRRLASKVFFSFFSLIILFLKFSLLLMQKLHGVKLKN